MSAVRAVAPSTNSRVRVHRVDVLSDAWYVLRRATFDYQHRGGTWRRQQREAYDRGDGATVLLYDPAAGTVLLTRQFRYPAYANGHPDGMLVEAPAGLFDDEDAEAAIRREAQEETGVCVADVARLFELLMSPGSVTERITFFAAPYERAAGRLAGGGIVAEGEDIELLEPTLTEALAMVERGEIVDAKTIVLLQWAAGQRLFGP